MERHVELVQAVITLDMILTGKTRHDCQHTARSFETVGIEEFIEGEIYYLSDGGHSRVNMVYSKAGLRLQLCMGARKEVEFNWAGHMAMNAREKIEEICNEYYEWALDHGDPEVERKTVYRKRVDSAMGVCIKTKDSRNIGNRRSIHTFVAKERRLNPHERRKW